MNEGELWNTLTRGTGTETERIDAVFEILQRERSRVLRKAAGMVSAVADSNPDPLTKSQLYSLALDIRGIQ